MQISTPTEAINSSENLHENGSTGIFVRSDGESPAIWGSSHKKGKPGIFAKLLEGLIAKTKNGAIEPNSGKAEAFEFPGAGKVEKNTLKTTSTKKAFNFIDNGEGEAGELRSDTAVALFKQGKLQPEQGLKGKTGLGKENSSQIKGELPPMEGFSNLKLNQVKNPDVVLAGRAEEGRNAPRHQGLNRDYAFPWHSGRDPAKGNQDFLNVSFRDMDAKFNQAHALANQMKTPGDEKENSRLSESRNRKNRLNIEVRDLRTGTDQAQNATDLQKGQIVNVLRPVSTEVEIPVNLNLSGGRGDGGSSVKTGRESSTNRGFEEALARELRSGLANDIVRDAAVILRNNSEGTIKLSLRPASLGDVKVRLEMAENKITGYIIVESSEALRAFERELPVLEKAFKDSGFSETNLEMSLAQDQWNFTQGGDRQEGDFPSVSPALAASRYEPETEWIEDPSLQGGLYLSASTGRTPVNLLV